MFRTTERTLRAIVWIVWALLDRLILCRSPYLQKNNIILVIRLDAIGDFVLWLEAARELISNYRSQGYSVLLLGNSVWANWVRDMDIADDVWGLNVALFRENLLYRWKWLIRIRKAGFKTAIQPTYSRAFLEGDSIVRASGAPERIGSEGDDSNINRWLKMWSDNWFTRLVPTSKFQLMELRRNEEFLNGFGIGNFRAKITELPIVASMRSKKLFSAPIAVIAPTASWEGKVWAAEKFAEIVHRLDGHGLNIVIVGGPADRVISDGLIQKISCGIVDLVGKTSLAELTEVLRSARIIVSNDTSAVHIGAAVNTPVICIAGGGHFGRFLPYDTSILQKEGQIFPVIVTEEMSCFGCNWKCQFPRQQGKSVKCIEEISVEKVWNAIELALKDHH